MMAFYPNQYGQAAPYGTPFQMQMGGYMPQPVPDQLAQLRMQQGQQMQAQMQQQSVQPSVVFVDSEEEARAYRVAMGSEVMFINLNAREVYTSKRSASIGEPPEFKSFELMEREEVQAAAQPQINGRRRHVQQRMTDYVTREELDAAIARAIDGLTKKEEIAHDETTV